MNILLICMIPVCIIATGFLVLKSVQLGLKWQIQTKEGKEPKLETPITKVVEVVQQGKEKKLEQYTQEQIKEWSPFQ